MAGYDPKKAELFNKLRKSGLGDEQAWRQAGLTDADEIYYTANDGDYNADGSKNLNKGQLGELIVGGGSKPPVLSAEEKAYRASIDAAGAGFDERLAADSARFDAPAPAPAPANVPKVDYPVSTRSTSSTKTVETYTSTSTEQVSGGGSKTVISGIPIPNADSKSYDPQIAAKQAEITQFMKDNPSDRQRAKEGLPPLSPEESAARNKKLTQLGNQKSDLVSQQSIAETRANSTETDVPNTTTNTTTTTFSQTATNTPVQGPNNADPALADQEAPSLANTQVEAARAENVPVQDSLSPGEELVNTSAPAQAADPFSVTPRSLEPGVENSSAANVSASQDSALLTPEQSIERAQVDAPAPVDAATFNANTNTSVLGALGVPPPVDPATDPNQSAAESARLARGGADAAANAATAENNALASAGAAYKQQAKEQAAIQAQFQSPANGDWRVRLRLAPSAKYLYMDENAKNGILAPLAASNGVVFPYMPTIQTSYNADYDSAELTHSNYRGQFYKSSYVGDVSITGIFTAQDTAEANYLLAVIHFFRSVTKMFYGAKDPLRGAPPPLVYLIGLGQYQFNNQPCVVKTFNYSMPNDCDYIRTKPNNYNTNLGGRSTKPQGSTNPISSVVNRLKNAALPQGAVPNVPAQDLLELQSVTNIADATYVPTKCEIQLTLMPIQTRSQQSQQFNMPDFANGNLLKGGFW